MIKPTLSLKAAETFIRESLFLYNYISVCNGICAYKTLHEKN